MATLVGKILLMTLNTEEVTILAIECATNVLTIALAHHDRVNVLYEGSTAKHGQCLLPLVKMLCQEESVILDAIDLVAVGIGPGSFTGVRTAITAAQGLALSLDKAVVGINSLQALAWQAQACGASGIVLTLLDARMGECYSAVYRCSDKPVSPELLVAPSLAKLETICTLLAYEPTVCIGNITVEKSKVWKKLQTMEAFPTAAAVAALGKLAWSKKQILLPEQLQALYVRNHVAMTISERSDSGQVI